MNKAKPTKVQMDYQDLELGIFIHFGIRTFYEGHKDWDGKKMELRNFNPWELDCGQWAEIALQCQAKYMVLTAKHHDGFANWPSEFTEYSVARTPWKGGKGDVVREFTDACRQKKLKIGLYYSPADWNCSVYDDESLYDDYFIKQVSELLDGRYGVIDMLWFDGCGSEGHDYDWIRIIGEIRKLQPSIMIFNMGDPDYRWIGNEAGLADLPHWNAVAPFDFPGMTDEKVKLETILWLPAECDFMIRDLNWFYSDHDEHTVKSAEELVGNYYYTVGRGANMLVNVGPDRRGLLPDKDSSSLMGFGQKLRKIFANRLLTLDDFEKESDLKWKWSSPLYKATYHEFRGTLLFDHIVLQENLLDGESVEKFKISITPYTGGSPVTVYKGCNIGHKAICHFPLVRCREIFIEILESDGVVDLKSIEVYNSNESQ